jgi:hypothetical protein
MVQLGERSYIIFPLTWYSYETGQPNRNVCLNVTYSTVRVGKHLSDVFPIKNGLKQGDDFSPLVFNFALEYAFRRVQADEESMQLNGTHRRLIYVDDVNILGGSIRSIKKNT